MRIVLFLLALACFPLQAQSNFGREPNTGQFSTEILFFQRSPDTALYFKRDSMLYSRGVEIQIENASPQATPALADALPTTYNYYLGNNPSNWVTGATQYRTVRFPNAYPGINASWRGGFNDGFERLSFNLAPGADPSLIRVRFKNLGDKPFEGPGGIWFTGGIVPGVFRVSIAASQGNPDTPLAATLNIASADTLTISSPNLDRTRPAEFVISFPNYQSAFGRPNYPPGKSSDGNLYEASSLDGPVGYDAVISRYSENGTPLWVTILGGTISDFTGNFTPVASGLVLTGQTSSPDFPVSTNAPSTKLLAQRTPFFTFLNRDSGLLLSSTYSPLNTDSGIDNLIPASNRDVIAGGLSTPSPDKYAGFLLRWRPTENLFLYNLSLPDPVRNLTNGTSGTTYYATFLSPRLSIAAINESGAPVGRPANYTTPTDQPRISGIRLLPAPNQSLFAFFSLSDQRSNTGFLANFSLLSGTTVFVQPLGPISQLSAFDLNPAGEPRILTNPGAAEILPTSANAPLVSPCLNSDYYARFSPTGRLLYATYVQRADFKFEEPEPSSNAPSLTCAAATAGRRPIAGIVPGQMITLTGGNFGPPGVINSILGPDGKFPTTLNGYSVRIGGTNAPIFAIARGLIAVQVPFETTGPTTTISITGPDAPSDLLAPLVSIRDISLFDTGDRENPTRLPALAALNQDGTINSKSNPATLSSIVSVFGSGLDLPAAPLLTGAFNPLSTIYPSAIPHRSTNCLPVYIGTAPGLSTAVFQANLRLTSAYEGTGTRPLPISLVVTENPRFLFNPPATAIVWVKN